MTTGRDFLAGYSGPGQDLVREGEPAPCFADPDPQPGPEELRRVPVPIIQNTATTTGSTTTFRLTGGLGPPRPPLLRTRRRGLSRLRCRHRTLRLGPGPLHSLRRDDLHVLKLPRQILYPARKISSLPKAKQPGIGSDRTTQLDQRLGSIVKISSERRPCQETGICTVVQGWPWQVAGRALGKGRWHPSTKQA
ncbi:hypothetical protein NtRootA4_36550 [Arthrobacter sp. NtRootA4]|nr:hypothetical protein NtRootA2_38760 [Arthrobacter sp. NtRootA2]BCW16676.1 hypothetical protein NtRootA4_36550 [Arthrobacter sp. NtRootA4]BCW25009.1 hypothetical protein NtRootC7_38760 [Arthrobacter sp. NtRootC7]BCW29278.1 hypothetical protein NtRootC45_38780 [Arthrobacter sp. NtRootC45]BCW33549.1 hypothetical protein NtRootD5_38800 [Arthrobacter sp. NtRootD5]